MIIGFFFFFYLKLNISNLQTFMRIWTNLEWKLKFFLANFSCYFSTFVNTKIRYSFKRTLRQYYSVEKARIHLAPPFVNQYRKCSDNLKKGFEGITSNFEYHSYRPPVFHHFPGAGWSRRWITTETCKKYRVWRRHKEGVRWDEPGHVCQRCRLENRDSRGCFLWFSGGNMWPVKKFGDYIQQETDWFIFVKNFAIDG